MPVMFGSISRCLLLMCCLTSAAVTAANIPPTIKLATTDWCPYACEKNRAQPGIAHEYVSLVLESLGYRADIAYYPWTRAIREVESGKRHGLLTAVPSEAPQMAFTQHPMMTYTMCFFTRTDSVWRYSNARSLRGRRLGVIADYGYGEPVDGFLQRPDVRANVLQISGHEGVARLIALLNLQRIDTFIEDSHVVTHLFVSAGDVVIPKVREAGCLDERPFFLALNPQEPWHQHLLHQLSHAFASAANQQMLETRVKTRYLK